MVTPPPDQLLLLRITKLIVKCRHMLSKKEFEDLQVGDAVFITNAAALLGWRFVCHIPQDVAEVWMTEHFRESYMSKEGNNPSTSPMKDWKVGTGVIVASLTAMPDEEKLNLLLKAASEDFRLYLSAKTRIKKESD